MVTHNEKYVRKHTEVRSEENPETKMIEVLIVKSVGILSDVRGANPPISESGYALLRGEYSYTPQGEEQELFKEEYTKYIEKHPLNTK